MRTVFYGAMLFAVAVATAGAEEGLAQLILTPEFRLGDAREMPLASSCPGWKAERFEYPEQHALEWQVRLQNHGDGEAPLYENLKTGDFVVQFPVEQPVTLHWGEGSHSQPSDFRPFAEQLALDQPRSLASFGGRSSDGVLPYFNLATEGGGLIVAVGWAGDWQTTFTALAGGRVRIEAGLKRSRFRLQQGERVRLPSLLVMAYRGDWLDGQNQFRRLLRQHFTPAGHPESALMPVAASVHGMIGFNDTNEANLLALLDDITKLELPLDTFWLDAGWNAGGFPSMQGNPDADPVRFPRGLAPLGRAVDQSGLRCLVWFEPERAMLGSWLQREHPDWLLQPSALPDSLAYLKNDGFFLLDLGDPQAREWAVESVSRYIRESKIDIYRQDCNLYPAYFWHTEEPPDETGLREVRFINGLYTFLDELVRRNPGLIIDNCAAGGRRLDFEMLRRSVVLWRSDSTWGEPAFPRNVQAMTLGLSHWLPLHGLGANAADEISLRSGMGVCASYAINYRDPASVEALHRHLARYLPVRMLFAADFYPLTNWNDRPEEWLAFQFHDPASGEGIVQAFRGPSAESRPLTLRLRGLEPERRYSFSNWDDATVQDVRAGADLLSSGMEVTATGAGAQAIVLQYRFSEPATSGD